MVVPIAVLAGTMIFLALVERVHAIRHDAAALLRPLFFTDVLYMVTGFVVLPLLEAYFLGSESQRTAGHTALPRWFLAAICFVLIDSGNYVVHLLLHRVEVLWEFHKVHHSSRSLDWLATFRSHLVEQCLRHAVAPAMLLVVGFPPDAIVPAGAAYIAWTMFVHSNVGLDLRLLEAFVITPSLHRLHHVPESSQLNLGGVLTVWDRLRGTLERNRRTTDRGLGVPGEITTYPQGWLRQLVEPAVRIVNRGNHPPGLSTAPLD